MKHPLSSKERRGLVAVAAAALLCMASGFIVRSCHHMALDNKGSFSVAADNDSTLIDEGKDVSNKTDKTHKTKKSNKTKKPKKTKKTKKSNKPKKSYPTRDPLSQPCD